MLEKIKWMDTPVKKGEYEDVPISLGRNGPIKTSGVEVFVVGNEVWMSPLTSKGGVGRCHVAIPSDPNILTTLAGLLLECADHLEKE